MDIRHENRISPAANRWWKHKNMSDSHTAHYINELKVNISSRHRQSSKVLDCTTTHPRVVHFVISLCPTVNTLHLTSDSKTTSHSSSAVYGSTTLLVHYFQPICLCRRVAKMLHCGVEGAQKLSAKGMRIEPRRVGIGRGCPPPQLTREFGERHELPSGIWGRALAANAFWHI